MGTVNVTLGDGKKLNLVLGQQLENAVTAVVFNFSAWKTEFGSGTLGLSVQRHGDDQPYAVVPTVSGNNATWNITELDTAYKGVGEVQVTYTVGSVVKKSTVYKFTVYRSLGENGEYPSPGQTWQEEIEDELADVKQDLAESSIVRIEPTAIGYYINTAMGTNTSYGVANGYVVDLTPQPSSGGLRYIIRSCEEGDEFVITGTGAMSGLLWAFLDSSNKIVSASLASATADGLLLVAPKASAKIITNFYEGGALYEGNSIPKHINDITDVLNGNTSVIDNKHVIARYTYSTFLFVEGITYANPAVIYKTDFIGDSFLDHLGGGTNTRILKVPCKGWKQITYTTFVSSSNYGSAFVDENGIIITGYVEKGTAGNKTLVVPPNADALVITVAQSIANTITLKLEANSLYDISKEMDYVQGLKQTKGTATEVYSKFNIDKIFVNTGLSIGTTTLSEVQATYNLNGYALKIPLDGIKTISYPVFKSSAGGMSFICDEDDVVIWAYNEGDEPTNTQKVVKIPENASYFVLTASGGLNAYDWTLTLSSLNVLSGNSEADNAQDTPFTDVNKNMCLAGIKTDILDNKIPFHRGFLFHKLQNNDGSLWYGTDFKHINNIGKVSYNPTLMRFAISPKDGRIIAVQRDTRNGIWVWDGTAETHLNNFETDPQAWLYNSGVDFIKDGSDEYCVFAEYSSNVVTGNVLNVWRGKYPYTSASNWEIVLSQAQGTNITHFHMVRRDPWTNILYLTAGDSSAESKWWYSTDKGATWTLLVSGTDTGWGNSLCRTINFVFTKDYIYWATDHGETGAQHHTLNRIQRNSSTGIMDLSTKEQVTLLPQLYATNSLCYVESPNGLFMYDRIDVDSTSVFGEPIKMMFWDFEAQELTEVASLDLTVSDWGGSRGKCYINYTNGRQPMPAMGFSIDTPCIFDLVCDNPSNIGTIAYDVGSKTVHTVDY